MFLPKFQIPIRLNCGDIHRPAGPASGNPASMFLNSSGFCPSIVR